MDAPAVAREHSRSRQRRHGCTARLRAKCPTSRVRASPVSRPPSGERPRRRQINFCGAHLHGPPKQFKISAAAKPKPRMCSRRLAPSHWAPCWAWH